MRKLISILLSALLMATAFSLCGQAAAPAASGKKLSVVTTIFPPYDFVRAVAGDNAEITMLLRPGTESHSYDPTPQDILKIKNCDVFIYGGGESDEWVEGVLESTDTSKMKIIALMDCVDVVEEEIVEGMQDEEEHSHDEDFEDSDVKDRPTFADWKGDWQSGYPYVLNGALDEAFEHKAEEDDSKTAEDYKKYYADAYRIEYNRIVIDDDTITYYTDKEVAKVKYEYKGVVILLNKSGQKRVRYQFQAVGETNGAPKYLQLSDHLIAPGERPEHFHLYNNNDGFEKLSKEFDNWPTFYPSSMTGADIMAELKGHDHEEEYDEHVWTSPANAKKIVQKICDTLVGLDSANANVYKNNTSAYIKKLDELDKAFKDVVKGAARKTLVFGDRFPFRYFADAYGLKYFAAFPGCSTETEASAATVAFLIDKVKAERIPVVFYIELSNEKIADTICEATGAKKLLLHASHNITRDDFRKGLTYLDIMTANVDTLKEALK
ncbi:MAG: zinc ABC transporter substrate-binding protein [Synergistaceae bacterium]|jgi:zinc transport system substrate-binding protein|nr:zinc ABC transporter substrate-binding protein [Synergistaceae bacterium]